MKKLMMILFLLFPVLSCVAQGSDADEGDPCADLALGVGIGNEGLFYGANVEMNAFGITLGARGSIHGGSLGFNKYEVKEAGVLAGVGCNSPKMSLSVTLGYAFSSYKYTGSNTSELSTYKEGGYWGPTGQVKLVGRCSERSGLGLIAFGNFNRREDIYGGMLVFDLAF